MQTFVTSFRFFWLLNVDDDEIFEFFCVMVRHSCFNIFDYFG